MSKQLHMQGPAFVDEPQREIDDVVERMRDRAPAVKRLTDEQKADQILLAKLMMDRHLARYEFLSSSKSRFRIVLDLPEPVAHVKFLGVDDDE
ncbi:MAG: hypothetical protein H0X39_00990 [Actinobacteria bacterium]|nr:hypothetical protein [Actinomycetota bacterium]